MNRRLGKTGAARGSLRPVLVWTKVDWVDDPVEPRWFREMWDALTSLVLADSARA